MAWSSQREQSMSVSHANLGYARHPGRAARQVHGSGTFDKLARAGYAAKGVLYLVIGGVATHAAIGAGGDTVDSKGALREIGQQPFGSALLVLLGIGLAAYGLFKLVEAFADPRVHGGKKGMALRAGKLGSAVVHGALAAAAFRMVAGGDSGGGSGAQSMTGRLMSQPFGQVLVAAAGVGILAFAIHQLIRAWKADIWKDLDTSAMSERARVFAERAGRAGYAARGVSFGIIGGFVVWAAVTADPGKAQGLDGALATLRDGAGGPIALGVVAIGLVAYAVFCFVRARHFRAAA